MYWVLDKKNDKPLVFGSIPVMEKKLKYKKRSLSIHFSEKKETSFIDENYRIERTNLIRTVRETETKKESVLTRLDSLDVGATFKYNLKDEGIFKILAKDEKDWFRTVKTQDGRFTGDFPWSKVYPV